AGDSASAQSVLQMTIQMGQRYNNSDPGQPMISELVGIAVERIALSAMDPNAPYGDNGGTAQQYLDQLTQQRDALRQLGQQAEPLYSQLSDRDWMLYKDRWMTLGEENALHWVINRYGQKESERSHRHLLELGIWNSCWILDIGAWIFSSLILPTSSLAHAPSSPKPGRACADTQARGYRPSAHRAILRARPPAGS